MICHRCGLESGHAEPAAQWELRSRYRDQRFEALDSVPLPLCEPCASFVEAAIAGRPCYSCGFENGREDAVVTPEREQEIRDTVRRFIEEGGLDDMPACNVPPTVARELLGLIKYTQCTIGIVNPGPFVVAFLAGAVGVEAGTFTAGDARSVLEILEERERTGAKP